MTRREFSQLRYFALDMALCWDNEVIQGRDEDVEQYTFLRGLQSVVNKMENLREFNEVYKLSEWAEHISWSVYTSPLYFLDEVPLALQGPELDIVLKLPKKSPLFREDMNVPKFRSVFGIRSNMVAVTVGTRKTYSHRSDGRNREHFGWVLDESPWYFELFKLP